MPTSKIVPAVAVLTTLLLLVPRSLTAQNAGPEVWIGTWKGPFVTDGPTGVFTLVVARDGDRWKVTNQVESEGVAIPAGEVRDWKVEGVGFSFVQAIGEFEVVFRGVMEGRELKGTVEGYQGGSLVGTGSFTLSRM
jgi:hypothetical protein